MSTGITEDKVYALLAMGINFKDTYQIDDPTVGSFALIDSTVSRIDPITGLWREWNPMDRDDDALHLSYSIGMNINCGNDFVSVEHRLGMTRGLGFEDRGKAVRAAIYKAAILLGKNPEDVDELRKGNSHA